MSWFSLCIIERSHPAVSPRFNAVASVVLDVSVCVLAEFEIRGRSELAHVDCEA